MMKSELDDLLSGVYAREYDGRRLGFIGIWSVNGRSLAVSLRKQGRLYVMGERTGYSLEKFVMIDRPLEELTVYDLREVEFIFLDEGLTYVDSIKKASKALSAVEIERHS